MFFKGALLIAWWCWSFINSLLSLSLIFFWFNNIKLRALIFIYFRIIFIIIEGFQSICNYRLMGYSGIILFYILFILCLVLIYNYRFFFLLYLLLFIMFLLLSFLFVFSLQFRLQLLHHLFLFVSLIIRSDFFDFLSVLREYLELYIVQVMPSSVCILQLARL